MRRTKEAQKFNPEKYGMIFCPNCGGSGRSFIDSKGDTVCKLCGGFGLIKRQEKDFIFDKRFPTVFQTGSPIHK